MRTNLDITYKLEIAYKTIESLRKNSFTANYFETAKEAEVHINAQIHQGMKVAFGGSATSRALNIRPYVLEVGAHLIDHATPGLTDEQKLEVLRSELTSDLFISSSNAITSSGHLVNVDGNGNRVAAMIFGPKKVIVIAGINKIVHSEEEAFRRIEHVAAPLNMKRLERKTPCVEDLTCHECSSPERGCRAYTIIRKRPALTPFEVIIIGEMLGM